MIWIILFYLSIFLILHSYLLYPLLVKGFAHGKKDNSICYKPDDDLPAVTILMAAYNEESVIGQKLLSIFNTSYPVEKIAVLIGSDSSSDDTDGIVNRFSSTHPSVGLVVFSERTGKAGIINHLVKKAKTDMLVLTDANVMFSGNTLFNMIRHFKNDQVSLVGGNIINSRNLKEGISIQEETYIGWENKTKYREGLIWGAMIGAFGGCYAIRKSWYAPVPPRFFMDDFFITMNVIENGGQCINELEAVCYEDVSNKIAEEFRRKVRISIGNFQNLGRYGKLLWPPWKGVGFAFLSHKVLRWLGPFFLSLTLIANIALFQAHVFFQVTLIIQLILMLLPLIDTVLRSFKVHLSLLRFITHFYFMNAALLLGFVKFIRGVKTNIWQPTQRYQ